MLPGHHQSFRWPVGFSTKTFICCLYSVSKGFTKYARTLSEVAYFHSSEGTILNQASHLLSPSVKESILKFSTSCFVDSFVLYVTWAFYRRFCGIRFSNVLGGIEWELGVSWHQSFCEWFNARRSDRLRIGFIWRKTVPPSLWINLNRLSYPFLSMRLTKMGLSVGRSVTSSESSKQFCPFLSLRTSAILLRACSFAIASSAHSSTFDSYSCDGGAVVRACFGVAPNRSRAGHSPSGSTVRFTARTPI